MLNISNHVILSPVGIRDRDQKHKTKILIPDLDDHIRKSLNLKLAYRSDPTLKSSTPIRNPKHHSLIRIPNQET